MLLKNIFTAVLVGVLVMGCEKSPFNGDISNPLNQEVRGRVALSDAGSPEGIYVWMEDTPLSTTTNAAGEFVIALPPVASNSSVYANRVFNLYFYVANYKLSSAAVTVVNGEFLYAHGEVNPHGELIGTRFMAKLLNINTEIDPQVVLSNYSDYINVVVTLSAVSDSVEVVFPKLIGGELGAILFRNLESGRIFTDAPEINAGVRLVKKIGKEPETFSFSFDLKRGNLPIGRYEVIPYFLIEQARMPHGLLTSISQKAQEVGPDFLKIPFRRAGGQFAIREIE